MSVNENPRSKLDYSDILKLLSKTKTKFTFQQPRSQHVSLPVPIIQYIIYQKESMLTLIKMYQTCKYFFKMCAVLPIYYEADCCGVNVYTRENLEHNFNQNVLFWFCDENLTLFSTCKSVQERIYCCSNLRNLYIRHLTTTYDKFLLIISNSTIEKLTIRDSTITYSNGSSVPLNVILQNFPHCTSLRFDIKSDTCLKGTLQTMNELNFFNKFTLLEIYILSIINENFDAKLLWKFVKKNLAFDSICLFTTLYWEAPKKELEFVNEMVQKEFNNAFYEWNKKYSKITVAL